MDSLERAERRTDCPPARRQRPTPRRPWGWLRRGAWRPSISRRLPQCAVQDASRGRGRATSIPTPPARRRATRGGGPRRFSFIRGDMADLYPPGWASSQAGRGIAGAERTPGCPRRGERRTAREPPGARASVCPAGGATGTGWRAARAHARRRDRPCQHRRRRLAHGHVQLELRLVVVDDRVEVSLADSASSRKLSSSSIGRTTAPRSGRRGCGRVSLEAPLAGR